MNKKVKGVIAISGVLAALASLVPMTSYAAEATCTTDSTSGKITCVDNASGVVNVKVNSVLTIDLVSASVDFGTVEPNQPKEENLSVKVTSNNPYVLSIRADQPNLVNKESSTNVIPAASGALTSGEGWGIKVKTGAGDDDNASTYTAVTNATNGVPFYTSTAGGKDVTTVFKVGLIVGPNTASGNYETSVTVIASTK